MVRPNAITVLYWSHDEKRVFVRCVKSGVTMYEQWEPVRYDDDGRGWAEGPDGWVCVFA